MEQKVWGNEHEALLRLCREKAGMDRYELAHLHAMSVKQIKQLEEGGDTNFYSPIIKFHAGTKLLRYFDVDIDTLDHVKKETDLPVATNKLFENNFCKS